MPVGVDEDAGVPAPDRGSSRTSDGAACALRFGQHRVDLSGRTDVVGQCHATPAATIGHDRVVGQLVAAPQRHDHPSGLEEDDLTIR